MPEPTALTRSRVPDTEKLTINLGFVDLGRIDLLVQEGFYANRSDFIRTAIRNQLGAQDAVLTQFIVRHMLDLGLRDYSRADLERARAAHEVLHIRVVGLVRLAADISAELALATIGSLTVLGGLQASAVIKAALSDRIH